MVWLVMMSLKNQVDIFSQDPAVRLHADARATTPSSSPTSAFCSALRNSLIVTLISAVVSMVLGSLAAYSLARFRLPVTTWLAVGLLLARMIPPIVFVVPLFLLYNALGLRN